MAVIIAADDSDGWYDHVMPPIINRSNTPLDFLLRQPAATGPARAAATGRACRCW